MDQTDEQPEVQQTSNDMKDDVEEYDVDMKSSSVGVQRKRVKLKKWKNKAEKKGITIIPPMEVDK